MMNNQLLSTARASRLRSRRLAIAMVALGIVLMVCQKQASDYFTGFLAPDGIYIPQPTRAFVPEDAKGDELTHTFHIYNLRPRRLQIQVEPDCGCAEVSWQSATIAPFGWKKLTAHMGASKKGQGGGSVSIALQTDSPKRKWLFVSLKS